MAMLLTLLKRFALGLLGLLSIWFLIIVLMPKKSLWYEAEALLVPKKVVIHGEQLDDRLLSLEVSDGELYLGALNVARIEKLSLMPLGLYNLLSVKNLFVGSELGLLKGLHIKHAHIAHLLFLTVSLEAEGNFGSLEGELDLDKHTLNLDIQPTAWLKKQTIVMSRLKKTAKGYHFAWHY